MGLGHGVTFLNALVTCCCSFLSLIGSIFIILSYAIVRKRNTPKSAFLIVHLAVSDFIWFLAAVIVSLLWFTHGEHVPPGVCYIVSPAIIFTRMASLYWTVIISFNVYMSVLKRKWFYKTQEDWENYRWKYYWVICLFGLPGMLMGAVKQYSDPANAQLGCSPRYEPLGVWYEVLFTEALPILFAFICNLYVFLAVRAKMSNAPVPQSVRKKRKRVMYHYVIVCILCWIPTIVLYLMEISGLHLPALEIVARTSLYLSGFFNFLVFGMQDPHLYRSFFVIMRSMGLANVFLPTHITSLKQSDVDKSVMFQEEALLRGKEPRRGTRRDHFMRTRKLSKEDKALLYSERPDLDPTFKIGKARKKRTKSSQPIDPEEFGEHEHLLDQRAMSSPGGYSEDADNEANRHNSTPKAFQYGGKNGFLGSLLGTSSDMEETTNSLHVALLAEVAAEDGSASVGSGSSSANAAIAAPSCGGERASMESIGDMEAGTQAIMMTRGSYSGGTSPPSSDKERMQRAASRPEAAANSPPRHGLFGAARTFSQPDDAAQQHRNLSAAPHPSSDAEESESELLDSDVSSHTDEDQSSEDEIDEEDEALMAVLFPQ